MRGKLLLFFLPWLTACHDASRPLSLAYINSPQIMQRYHGTLAQRQLIEASATRWQRSLDSLTATLTTLRTARPSQQQQAQLARYRVTLQEKIQSASQEADQALLQEVNQYLKAYGAAHSYDFIFGANESGNIVYAVSGKDLTEEVLQGLNQQYDQRHPFGQ